MTGKEDVKAMVKAAKAMIKAIESGVKPGDLVEVYWNDASIWVGISLGVRKR